MAAGDTATAAPEAARRLAFDVAVASHLEPEARNWANREIYIERGLA